MKKFYLNIDVELTVQIPVEAWNIKEAILKAYTDDNIRLYLKDNSDIFDTYLTSVSDFETGKILKEYNEK